jgi:lyso-ornithine lipid O-acyltransferase
MSAASSLSRGGGASRVSLAGPATLARLGLVVLVLAAFLVVFAPPLILARKFGRRVGERSPARFQRLICAGLGVRVRAHGAPDRTAPCLIVANHVSWLDVPVLGSLAPMTFLAKKEVGDHPLGREIVALQGAVYVDRSRRSRIPEVNARMVERMRDSLPVVLFAEATTGDGNRLLPFRTSHFEAIRLAARDERAAVVQPVFLHYSRLAGLPIIRSRRPRIAWYGDMTFLAHLLRFAASGGAICDLYFGSPIPVSPDMHRKAIARMTERAIRELKARARVAGQGSDETKAGRFPEALL